MTYADTLELLQRKRAELRDLERQAEREAKRMQPLTVDDERRMVDLQARADSAYIAANRRAPPPHAYERPDEYGRRLAVGLQPLSPQWSKVDLDKLSDSVFEVARKDIYADAVANGRTFGLRPGEMREIDRSNGVHRITEFVGDPDTVWFGSVFTRPPKKAQFFDRDSYMRMSRDANAARVEEIIRGYQRPQVRVPAAAF